VRKRWRCFFCDEVFTSSKAAALHFGTFDSCEPDTTACKLMSHQQHVLEYIRGLEEEIRQYQDENHPTIKALYALEDDMRRAVVRAEEEGYNKGVRDMTRENSDVKQGSTSA
jgi:hypothetical protein